MSAVIRRAALRNSNGVRGGYGRVQRRFASDPAAAKQPEEPKLMSKGARRDPELYILLGIMTCAFAGVGYYFGSKPTSASSEAKVSVADGSSPWQTETDAHYRYHPGGDKTKTAKDAPSALNTVIVPNVNLPKSLHDRFNKWGKDGY